MIKDMEGIETFYIKAGDRKPTVWIQLLNQDGSVKDLTGVVAGDVRLVVASVAGGRRLVDMGEMGVKNLDYAAGIVGYSWADGDLKAGEYLMEVIVKNGTEDQETFPKHSYYKLVVTAHL